MAKRTKQRSLTGKQEKFCQEYIVDLNATQAAIRAHYAAHSINAFRVIGCHNLMKVNIKTEIGRLKAVISEETGVTTKWVIDKLVEVAERCTQPPYDNPGANKAIELLGKHVGVFEADNAQKGDKAITIINFNQRDDTKQIISGPAGPARVTGSKGV